MTIEPISKFGIASLGIFHYNNQILNGVMMNRPERVRSLIGLKFGKLTVIENLGKHGKFYLWKCLCDCGGFKDVPGTYLIQGETKTCGCRFSIDLTDQRFGKLFVVRPIKKKGFRGRIWLCLCDCGKECEIYGGHLRARDRTSCGCGHEVNIEKTGCKILFSTTKRKCRILNRDFSLSLEEFSKLIKQNCSYCGNPPAQEIKRMKSKKTQIIYNGIDRVNSSLGYTIKNCVTCCKKCNRSKSDMPLKEWENHLLKMVNFMGLK